MEAKKHETDSIREVRSFVDDQGREIKEFTQVFGEKRDPKFYKGVARLVIQAPDPRIPPQDIRLEFLFDDGTTLKQAFATFDERGEKEKNRWVEQQRKMASEAKKQVVGVRGKLSNLFGPSGKPIK